MALIWYKILSFSQSEFLSGSLIGLGLVCLDSLAPSEPRSLGSKKRECRSDEISQTDDVQGILNDQVI